MIVMMQKKVLLAPMQLHLLQEMSAHYVDFENFMIWFIMVTVVVVDNNQKIG